MLLCFLLAPAAAAIAATCQSERGDVANKLQQPCNSNVQYAIFIAAKSRPLRRCFAHHPSLLHSRLRHAAARMHLLLSHDGLQTLPLSNSTWYWHAPIMPCMASGAECFPACRPCGAGLKGGGAEYSAGLPSCPLLPVLPERQRRSSLLTFAASAASCLAAAGWCLHDRRR